MHVHNVYFWLKEDLDEDSLVQFEAGLKSLVTLPEVVSGYYGKPAQAYRDVVENTYSYGLFLVFEDLVGHDMYQVGEGHLKFIDENLPRWEKVVAYAIENAGIVYFAIPVTGIFASGPKNKKGDSLAASRP